VCVVCDLAEPGRQKGQQKQGVSESVEVHGRQALGGHRWFVCLAGRLQIWCREREEVCGAEGCGRGWERHVVPREVQPRRQGQRQTETQKRKRVWHEKSKKKGKQKRGTGKQPSNDQAPAACCRPSPRSSPRAGHSQVQAQQKSGMGARTERAAEATGACCAMLRLKAPLLPLKLADSNSSSFSASRLQGTARERRRQARGGQQAGRGGRQCRAPGVSPRGMWQL
jgi:hypothetical protein